MIREKAVACWNSIRISVRPPCWVRGRKEKGMSRAVLFDEIVANWKKELLLLVNAFFFSCAFKDQSAWETLVHQTS